MDHDKQLAKMDPKLREAYQKVMGTSPNTPSSPASEVIAPVPPPSAPIAEPSSPPVAEPTAPIPSIDPAPAAPPPAAPPEQPAAPAFSSTLPEVPLPKTPEKAPEMVHVGGTPVTQSLKPAQAESMGKKGGSSTALTLGGLFVFFLVYTLICMKLLGMALPFVPKGVIPGF